MLAADIISAPSVTYPTSEWRTQASVAKIYVHWLQHSFLEVIVEKYILDQLSYKLHTLALCS
jgi:CRISPR/Cas system-associated endoribonuclease Cas2